MLVISHQCHDHHPVICSVRCSTNAPGHEAHDNRKNGDRVSYDICCGDGLPFAVVDMCQLVSSFLRRNAVIDSPANRLRSHVDDTQSLEFGKFGEEVTST